MGINFVKFKGIAFMNHRNILLIIAVLFFLSIFLVVLTTKVESMDKKVCIYFFWGQGCQRCARIESFLNQLEQKYSLDIYKFEIYNNRSNLILLNKYFDKYQIREEERGIPAIFISNIYLIGDKPILDKLEEEIKSLPEGSACPELVVKNVTGEIDEKSPLKKLGLLSLAVVTSAALVDSINPCAIGILLILLGALFNKVEKKKVLKTGIAFIISIYITYFLFGIGLFSALQVSGLSYYFYEFIGLLAIIIGLLNIKDSFWYGKGGFAMEIPQSWRPTIKKLLTNLTNPKFAFLMGFLVGLFELPCTGGPYIFILGLLAERTTRLMAVLILLYYNLLFILPLIIITIILYLGYFSVEKASEWKDKNIKILHFIIGLIMLILGIVVILGLV